MKMRVQLRGWARVVAGLATVAGCGQQQLGREGDDLASQDDDTDVAGGDEAGGGSGVLTTGVSQGEGHSEGDGESDGGPTSTSDGGNDEGDTSAMDTGSTTDPVGCSSDDACNDDDPCTLDACEDSQCTHQAKDCDDSVACTIDRCSPDTGACEHELDDTACDDSVGCTIDRCEATGCTNEPDDSICDDGLECTIDRCDPVGGCEIEPDDTVCRDTDACNGDESCDPGRGCVPGSPVSCGDGNMCTVDSCNPADGTCSYDPPACMSGDGCCPDGCTEDDDADCGCVNLALQATPSHSFSSGQESQGYGPSNYVDGVDETGCVAGGCSECFGWVSNGSTPSGDFIELQWNTEVSIGSMRVDTERQNQGACGFDDRNVQDGIVQAWNGNSWSEVESFSNESDDLRFVFDPPLETTRIRLHQLTTPAGGLHSIVYEVAVFGPPNCVP